MCLSCQYGYIYRCYLCNEKECGDDLYEYLFDNRYEQLRSLKCYDNLFDGRCKDLCYNCIIKLPKKRRCRTCKVICDSGNKLFKHLCQYPDHSCKYNYDDCVKDFPWISRYDEPWIKNYEDLGFLI